MSLLGYLPKIIQVASPTSEAHCFFITNKMDPFVTGKSTARFSIILSETLAALKLQGYIILSLIMQGYIILNLIGKQP